MESLQTFADSFPALVAVARGAIPFVELRRCRPGHRRGVHAGAILAAIISNVIAMLTVWMPLRATATAKKVAAGINAVDVSPDPRPGQAAHPTALRPLRRRVASWVSGLPSLTAPWWASARAGLRRLADRGHHPVGRHLRRPATAGINLAMQ